VPVAVYIYVSIAVLGVLAMGLMIAGHVVASGRSAGRATFRTAGLAPKNAEHGATSAPAARAETANKEYRAVTVVCEGDSCAAAQALEGKKILLKDGGVPKIPLAGCTSSECHCRYKHFEDRREPAGDRRLPGSIQTSLYQHKAGSERRQARGRRTSDR
jgi:hypothetical protein